MGGICSWDVPNKCRDPNLIRDQLTTGASIES